MFALCNAAGDVLLSYLRPSVADRGPLLSSPNSLGDLALFTLAAGGGEEGRGSSALVSVQCPDNRAPELDTVD